MTEFDAFWSVWPNRVARKAAEKAFTKARKQVSLDTIIAGVERYIRTKPQWQNWMHAASFLNGERWADETPAPQLTGLDAMEADLARRIADRGRGAGQRGADPEPVQGLSLLDWEGERRLH